MSAVFLSETWADQLRRSAVASTPFIGDDGRIEQGGIDAACTPPIAETARVIRSVVEQRGFCHLRGCHPSSVKPIASSLACALGCVEEIPLYPGRHFVVSHSSAVPNESGDFSVEALSPHTDWRSMESPVRLICIACVEADPGYPALGTNSVYDVREAELGLRGSGLWQAMQTTTCPFPLLDESRVVERPLLTVFGCKKHTFATPRFRVRYCARRIKRGFDLLGTDPSQAQAQVMSGFEEALMPIRNDLSLDAGEMLFVDNFIALHNRRRTSVRITESATEPKGRSIFVLSLSKLR